MSCAGMRVPLHAGRARQHRVVDRDRLPRPRQARQSPLHLHLHLTHVYRDVLHAGRLRLGTAEQVAHQLAAPVEGEDPGRFVNQLQAHQAVAVQDAGAVAARRRAAQNAGVDDAVHLPQRHAGHARRLVGGQHLRNCRGRRHLSFLQSGRNIRWRRPRCQRNCPGHQIDAHRPVVRLDDAVIAAHYRWRQDQLQREKGVVADGAVPDLSVPAAPGRPSRSNRRACRS